MEKKDPLTSIDIENIKKSIIELGRGKAAKLFNISYYKTYSIVSRSEQVKSGHRKKRTSAEPLTKEELEKLQSLYNNGKSISSISKQLNISRMGVFRWIDLMRLKKRHNRFTKEDEKRLIALHDPNLSYSKLAQKVGINITTLKRKVKQLGLR